MKNFSFSSRGHLLERLLQRLISANLWVASRTRVLAVDEVIALRKPSGLQMNVAHALQSTGLAPNLRSPFRPQTTKVRFAPEAGVQQLIRFYGLTAPPLYTFYFARLLD
jgi:hypothetical protein